MYQIERQGRLYKTLPQAVFFSPSIVAFTVLNLLLPLSGVFAPGSLTVVTKNSTGVRGPCMIPSGNLSTPNTPDSNSLFTTDQGSTTDLVWKGFTPRATELTMQCLVEQRIPDLPRVCGPDCRYNVSVASFVIQCTPNPSSLPYMLMGGDRIIIYDEYSNASFTVGTLWNGTKMQVDTDDPDVSAWPFYIGWHSNDPNGKSGNASCSPFEAQYDVVVRPISLSTSLSLINFKYKLKVQTKGGIQFVTTNVTQITSPLPSIFNMMVAQDGRLGVSAQVNSNFSMQRAALYSATQALFLGTAAILVSGELDDNMLGQPSFLELNFSPYPQFVWGDVLKGIEDIASNVTAALLTLQLGNISSECFFDQQTVIYRYSAFALWVPYGVSHFSLLML